jgi:hypothetical protein
LIKGRYPDWRVSWKKTVITIKTIVRAPDRSKTMSEESGHLHGSDRLTLRNRDVILVLILSQEEESSQADHLDVQADEDVA